MHNPAARPRLLPAPTARSLRRAGIRRGVVDDYVHGPGLHGLGGRSRLSTIWALPASASSTGCSPPLTWPTRCSRCPADGWATSSARARCSSGSCSGGRLSPCLTGAIGLTVSGHVIGALAGRVGDHAPGDADRGAIPVRHGGGGCLSQYYPAPAQLVSLSAARFGTGRGVDVGPLDGRHDAPAVAAVGRGHRSPGSRPRRDT